MKRVIVLLVAFALGIGCAFAQDPSSYNDYSHADPLPITSDSLFQLRGDPVYVANGDLRIRKVDFSVPSVGFPFVFVRTYKSRSTYNGRLGHKWEYNLNMRLNINGFGDVEGFDGGNRMDLYTEEASDARWDPPAGRFDRIVRPSPSATTLERITAQGFKFVYEETSNDSNWYRIKSMEDLNGNSQSFLYDATTTAGKLTEVKDTNARSYTFLYDVNGRMTELKDFGTTPRLIVYEYDSGGDLVAVVDLDDGSGLERETTYTYDATDHLVETITDGKENAKGSPVPFVRNYYDDDDRVVAQEYGTDASTDESPSTPTSTSTSNAFLFTYNATNTVFTDRGGRKSKSYFDANGMITKQVYLDSGSSEVFETTYTYDSNFNVTTMVKPNGDAVLYTYGTADRYAEGTVLSVTTASDAAGSDSLTRNYSYDHTANNALTKIEEPSGSQTFFEYDSRNNLLTTTQAYGTTSVFDSFVGHYDSSNHYLLDWSEDGVGNRTSFDYDSDNYLVKIRGDSGTGGANITVAEYDYDEFGNVIWSKDGLGNKTEFAVNRLNQVTQVTAPSPLSYKTDFTYDESGNVITVSVDNGDGQGSGDFVTAIEYDLLDHVTKRTEDIDGSTTRSVEFRYNVDELLTGVTDPEDSETEYFYDLYHRNTKIRVASADTEEADYTYFYDENFRLTEERQPKSASHKVTYAFDHHDRLTKTTNALGNYVLRTFGTSSHLLDKVENFESGETDPDAQVKYSYDLANRVTGTDTLAKVSRGGSDIGDGYLSATTEFDDAGNVLELKDDDGTVQATYTYDGLNRVSTVTDVIGSKATYTYDAASNVLTLQEEEAEDASATTDTFTTSYKYDNLNRLTETKDSGNFVWKFTYDERNLVTSEDPNGYKTYSTFDELNRLVKQEHDRTSSAKIDVEYAYDKSGRLTTLTDAEGNETGFEYDARDRMTKKVFADTYDMDWEFDDNGNVVKRTDQNGTVVNYLYDVADRLTEKTFSVTAPHIKGETTKQEYAYDALGRLVDASDTNSAVEYTYNTLGLIESEKMQYGPENITNNTWRTVEWDYNVQGLVTAARYPYADATNGEIRYSYDDSNRATKVTRQASGTASSDRATSVL